MLNALAQWDGPRLWRPGRYNGRRATYALGLLVAFAQNADAEPYIPAHDSTIVEHLASPISFGPTASAPTGRTDLTTALATARTYINAARAKADPRYYGRAMGVLKPWWNATQPPQEVRVLRAVVRQASHEFDAALDDLNTVLAADPRNTQAWLSKAMILRAQGKRAAGAKSCRHLQGLVDDLITSVCLAHVDHLGSSLRDGYQTLTAVVLRASASPASHRQWGFAVLAELAVRLGDSTAAERFLRAALAVGGSNVGVLAAYADLLLDQGAYLRVQNLLRNEAAADGLLLRLALATRALDDPQWRAQATALEARFAANRQRGSVAQHLREEARAMLYLFDKPRQGLATALRNWAVQREAWDARLLLEAAQLSGQPEASAPACDWLTREGVEDTRLSAIAACATRS